MTHNACFALTVFSTGRPSRHASVSWITTWPDRTPHLASRDIRLDRAFVASLPTFQSGTIPANYCMNARHQYVRVRFHNSSPKSRKVTSDLVTNDLIKGLHSSFKVRQIPVKVARPNWTTVGRSTSRCTDCSAFARLHWMNTASFTLNRYSCNEAWQKQMDGSR